MEFRFARRFDGISGSAIREIFKLLAVPGMISFAGGNPAADALPDEEMAQLAREVLLRDGKTILQYGATEGYAPLRDEVKKILKKRGIFNPDYDDVIITSGAQQANELSTKVLCNEGDTLLVENPCFIGSLNAFKSYHVDLQGVTLEEDGVNIAELEEKLKAGNVKLVYLIPNFQNPTGNTMSWEKRQQAFDLCGKYGAVILEDNPYGELRFAGREIPTIKSMDTDGIVVYCGSFSKVLAPGLRIGFVCANRALIQKLVVAKQVEDVHTPMLTQLLASEYLKRYNLDDAIVKMRALYRRKCAGMLAAIERYFPEGVTHTTPKGGLFVWCDLGHGLDTQKLTVQAMARKVVYVPGATFMTDMNRPCSGLRLNYSTMTDDRIEEGIRLLGEVFTEALDKLEESDE